MTSQDTWTKTCEDAEPGDGLSHAQVQYFLAWDRWLCDTDRFRRGDAELKTTPPLPGPRLPLEGILQL